jgi:hypothetical protein
VIFYALECDNGPVRTGLDLSAQKLKLVAVSGKLMYYNGGMTAAH